MIHKSVKKVLFVKKVLPLQKVVKINQFKTKRIIMKKFFMSLCAAVAMFTLVACEGNPGIEACQNFIDNPTPETSAAVDKVLPTLSSEEDKELLKWMEENWEALRLAKGVLNMRYPDFVHQDSSEVSDVEE